MISFLYWATIIALSLYVVYLRSELYRLREERERLLDEREQSFAEIPSHYDDWMIAELRDRERGENPA